MMNPGVRGPACPGRPLQRKPDPSGLAIAAPDEPDRADQTSEHHTEPVPVAPRLRLEDDTDAQVVVVVRPAGVPENQEGIWRFLNDTDAVALRRAWRRPVAPDRRSGIRSGTGAELEVDDPARRRHAAGSAHLAAARREAVLPFDQKTIYPGRLITEVLERQLAGAGRLEHAVERDRQRLGEKRIVVAPGDGCRGARAGADLKHRGGVRRRRRGDERKRDGGKTLVSAHLT